MGCMPDSADSSRVRVFKIPAEEWAAHSENAHLATFAENKPANWDRISYALLIVHNEIAQGYVTVRELDPDTVYWQFGGRFIPVRGSAMSLKLYRRLLEEQGKLSRYMTTFIENTNFPMLRLALAEGLKIIGIRNALGTVLLELVKEWPREEKVTNGNA